MENEKAKNLLERVAKKLKVGDGFMITYNDTVGRFTHIGASNGIGTINFHYNSETGEVWDAYFSTAKEEFILK